MGCHEIFGSQRSHGAALRLRGVGHSAELVDTRQRDGEVGGERLKEGLHRLSGGTGRRKVSQHLSICLATC